MSPRAIPPLIACLLVTGLVSAAGARPPVGPDAVRHPQATGAQGVDNSQRIDINRISMVVTNTGSIAWDKITGGAGLEFPKGSGKTAVFAAGSWLGAMVGGQPRIALSEYSDEYGPGSMVGGVADDPNRPEYKVYKLNRGWASTIDRDAALADYNAGAVPRGAPVVTVLGDGTLSIPGDQMLWCVFNDASPSNHTNGSGNTPPLGIETQLTAFAYSQAGPPGPVTRTVFLRYKFINKGANTLQDLHVGMWCDPDLGGAADDLVGCDPSRSMGYVYNANYLDAIYGTTPPALGIDVVRGPRDAGGVPLPMTAFVLYPNGGGPRNAAESYFALRGLSNSGLPVFDPSTGLPTSLWVSGDPVWGTGWIDAAPSDKRMILSSGPVLLSPGESQEVTYAIVVGEGSNRLASVQSLRCNDDQVQSFVDRAFAPPLPAAVACEPAVVINCPRPASYWTEQCLPGVSEFTFAQVDEIARRVDAASSLFNWGADPVGNLSATLDPAAASTPRGRALREFAAFQCNLAASHPQILPASGQAVYLDPVTPIACPGLTAQYLFELAISSAGLGLADASYINVGPNPPALLGVGLGLPFWDQSAGYAADLYGSSIPSGSPNTGTVEIRFTGGATGQYAYRYLRTVDSFGGRAYLIQDYVPVPWTLWDTNSHIKLNGAFLEDAGPPPSPNMDGTWNPDASALGGRELIWVMNSEYSGDGTPDPRYFTDPALQDALGGQVDFRYVVWPRRTAPDAVIDNGDIFRFKSGFVPGPSVDAMLLNLITFMDPTDPTGPQRYDEITACLSAINTGYGIGATCNGSTPTLISLVGSDVTPDRVTVTWDAGGSAPSSVEVERREAQGDWASLGAVAPDGRGWIVYEDRHVVPGLSYSYRLRVTGAGGSELMGETTVAVPLQSALGLEGFRPNPAGRGAQIAFSLPSGAPATLALFDVAGRRRFSHEVGAMGPGRHVVPLGDVAPLPSGMYLLRLTQGGHSVTRRVVTVQ